MLLLVEILKPVYSSLFPCKFIARRRLENENDNKRDVWDVHIQPQDWLLGENHHYSLISRGDSESATEMLRFSLRYSYSEVQIFCTSVPQRILLLLSFNLILGAVIFKTKRSFGSH